MYAVLTKRPPEPTTETHRHAVGDLVCETEFAADFAVFPTIIAVSLVLLAAFAAVDFKLWNIELAVALTDAAAELFPG